MLSDHTAHTMTLQVLFALTSILKLQPIYRCLYVHNRKVLFSLNKHDDFKYIPQTCSKMLWDSGLTDSLTECFPMRDLEFKYQWQFQSLPACLLTNTKSKEIWMRLLAMYQFYDTGTLYKHTNLLINRVPVQSITTIKPFHIFRESLD